MGGLFSEESPDDTTAAPTGPNEVWSHSVDTLFKLDPTRHFNPEAACASHD